MANHVKFESKVEGAAIDLVIFDIEGVQVSAGPLSIKYEKDINDGTLNVDYKIGGPNGASFKIKYSCTSDGQPKTDLQKPSPITGSIAENGGVIVTIKIPL
ncbi:hypothetical protein GCM10023149_28700 [Mucilaginibacter gynuensis]|uniref:Uncharacterized protein n=1 Tax=Mucilaginibacter gynuensis TaxID=1302236 RepID=A0ABP8GKM3_9SPHI